MLTLKLARMEKVLVLSGPAIPLVSPSMTAMSFGVQGSLALPELSGCRSCPGAYNVAHRSHIASLP